MTTQTEELVIYQMKLGDLKEHPDNPRKHFDKLVLEEMAASIRQVGVLVPLLVRQQGSYWQILAGARRFRAAKLAELETVAVIVRDLDDAAALELMVLDNLQRADLHPLEEAAGFQQLMKVAHYDVARVAERVGRSVKYVYDRVKLLQLTKEAKALFLADRITAGHAILLARLSAKDQALAMDEDRGGLWTPEGAPGYLFAEAEREEAEFGHKPRSVRELQGWIDDHVRFDTREPDPMLFPDTAAAITEAGPMAKIIAITFEHYVQHEAKDATRIYGPRSWKYADGEEHEDPSSMVTRKIKTKTCDRSGLGVVVAGERRGEAFQVCVNRACEVHFPAQAKKAKARGTDLGTQGKNEQASAAARAESERREEEKRKRWISARPAILEAIGAKVKVASAASTGPLAALLIQQIGRHGSVKSDAVPRGRTAEDLVRHLAFLSICSDASYDWQIDTSLPRLAKQYGVDAAKILNQVAPVQTSAKPSKSGSGKTRAKKGGKK